VRSVWSHSMSLRRLAPMFDRVLVQKVKPQHMVGGVALPDSVLFGDKKGCHEARVVAVGKGLRSLDGKFTAPVFNVGDRIILPEFTTEVTFDGEDYILIREEDVLAKIEDANTPSGVPDLRNLPK